MNIVKIGEIPAQSYEAKEVSKKEVRQNNSEKVSANEKDQSKKANWQKDILVSALDKLENSIQLDESHPLDNMSNQPIESFDEAKIELSFIKSPFFKEQAAEAQANIEPESILSLFADEAELVK